MRDLVGGNIVKFHCDRFQSKGDFDSITPQVKIISPAPGDVINRNDLAVNGNGQRLLPVKIVISPEFDLDFTQASSAGSEYAFLPQVDGVGHAYLAPEIAVTTNAGDVTGVTFVGSDNRSDLVGGFCVFRAPELITADYQVVTVLCPIQGEAAIANGNYRVIVDFTDHSHGPRMKNHPRDVPPRDQVSVVVAGF